LGYEAGFFEEVTRDASTALRPLRYPPVPAARIGEVVWGCRHTDGNLVSVLPPSTGTGLKVKVRGGAWIDAATPPGHSIVQVGDMLQYMTGGHLRSAVHRIDAPDHPTAEARYSAPLFVYPRADVDLRPHPRWAANPARFPSRTAGAFFAERLRRVGLDAVAAG
jgi:isopenicillin N synthase-like dioxygenase